MYTYIPILSVTMSGFDRAPMYSLPPRIKLELACLTDEEIHFWEIPIRKLFEVILYLKNTSKMALIWNIFDSTFGLGSGMVYACIIYYFYQFGNGIMVPFVIIISILLHYYSGFIYVGILNKSIQSLILLIFIFVNGFEFIKMSNRDRKFQHVSMF